MPKSMLRVILVAVTINLLGVVLVWAQSYKNPDPNQPYQEGQIFAQATNPSLTITVRDTDGTCAGTNFDIFFEATSEAESPPCSQDDWGYNAWDGFGVALSTDWTGFTTPGNTVPRTRDFGPTAPSGQINGITARPITVELYDLCTAPPSGWNTQAIYDDIASQATAGAPLLESVVYDPAIDVPDCANLPQVPPVPTVGLGALTALALLWLMAGMLALRR